MAPPQNDDEARGAVADATASVVDSHLLTLVIAAAADRDKPLLRTLLIDLHPADLADVLRHIHEHARDQIITLIGPELPPEMLLELDEDLREDVLKLLPSDFVGKALGEMDTDDAATLAAA